MEIPRMDEKEIKDLARLVVTNIVFLTNNPETLMLSFGLPIAMMFAGDEFEKWEDTEKVIDAIGAVYERYDNASPRAINGLPMFTSVNIVHSEDIPALIIEIERMEKALE